MGASQAANTLVEIEFAARERRNEKIDAEERKQLIDAITASYDEQQDIRYGAARGWLDRIIEPEKTRDELTLALSVAVAAPIEGEFKTGVLQT